MCFRIGVTFIRKCIGGYFERFNTTLPPNGTLVITSAVPENSVVIRITIRGGKRLQQNPCAACSRRAPDFHGVESNSTAKMRQQGFGLARIAETKALELP